MPEPITTTVGLGAIAAYLGKDGLEKLLGPTAEYLGNGLRDMAQRRVENVGKIFRNAQNKLGQKTDAPGEVPPRVLKTVLDEGSFCEDAIAVEYFGGVLASSRTENGRDDRGARIAKLLDSLSSYQLRTHYLVYSTVKNLFSESGLSMNMKDRPKMQVYLRLQHYAHAMAFNQSELNQFQQIVLHVFFGLHNDGLIEGDWQVGPKEEMKKIYPEAPDGGIVCQPSALGTEVFLWAFGHSDKELDYIFNLEFKAVMEGVLNGVPEASPVKNIT